jgi:hypothetical protein
MFWYVRHPKHPTLYLRVSRSLTKGIAMAARGETLLRANEQGEPFLLRLPDGETQRIYVEDVPFDFAPVLRIEGETIPVAPPLRIWEKGLTIFPLAGALLVGLGVHHNGMVPGMLATFGAAAVLRSGLSRFTRTVCTLALAASATMVAFRWNVPASRAAMRQALEKSKEPVWDALQLLPEPTDSSSPRPATALSEAAEPLQPGTVFRLRDMLITAEFDSLEALFDTWSAAAARDVAHEPRLYDAFYAFRAVNPDFEGALDRWIDERPSSVSAHLARATYFADLAYRKRGGEGGRSTPRANISAMKLAFEASLEELGIALRMNPRAVHAYWLATEIAMGYGDMRGVLLALERSLSVTPLSFFSRARAMIALRPRWGGSYELMQIVAMEADSLRSRNPELDRLPGFIPWDAGNAAWLRSDTALALKYLDEAMTAGQTVWFCSERGELREDLDQGSGALADLDCAASLRPTTAETRLSRSRALYDIARAMYPADWKARFGRVEAEADLAFRLDSLNDGIRRHHDFVAKQRKTVRQ